MSEIFVDIDNLKKTEKYLNVILEEIKVQINRVDGLITELTSCWKDVNSPSRIEALRKRKEDLEKMMKEIEKYTLVLFCIYNEFEKTAKER